MGCVISASGISPTEEKVEAIKQAPRPENLTQLRAFLGMINYHGKFIRNLSSILQPLNQLLQGNQEFKWSPRCEEAFKKAKDSPFQSAEYEEFLRQNGIQRILVSPYHPSSNGLAERFVQTFKYALESSLESLLFKTKNHFLTFVPSNGTGQTTRQANKTSSVSDTGRSFQLMPLIVKSQNCLPTLLKNT